MKRTNLQLNSFLYYKKFQSFTNSVHVKSVIISLALFLGITIYGIAGSGDIVGYVYNSTDNKPLPGAHVYLKSTSGDIGTVTDLNGKYTLSPISSGTYVISIKYIGYEEVLITGVEVFSNRTTVMDNITLQPKAIEIGNDKDMPKVIGRKHKLVDPEKVSLKGFSSKMLKDNPNLKSVPDLLGSLSSDISKDSNGELYIRGSRAGSITYFVDGVKTNSSNTVIGSSIGSLLVYTGGVPAEYGDFTGGVIVIETKSFFDLFNQWNSLILYH